MNIHPSHPIDDAVDRIAGHDFLALRAGVYVTMDAGQIAELAEVELEDFGAIAPKEESMGSERSGERSPEAIIELRRELHLSASCRLSADKGASAIVPHRTPADPCPQPGSERSRERRNRLPQSGE